MRGCRECADNAGTCPHDGQPCGSTTDVVEAFAEYLERHRKAGIISFPERIVWQDACKWQREQLAERSVKMSELFLACRELIRYDGIDSDRVRSAVDKIDRIVFEVQRQLEKGELG